MHHLVVRSYDMAWHAERTKDAWRTILRAGTVDEHERGDHASFLLTSRREHRCHIYTEELLT